MTIISYIISIDSIFKFCGRLEPGKFENANILVCRERGSREKEGRVCVDQAGTSLVVYCPLVLLERGEGVCGSDRDQFGCLLSTSTIRKRGGCVWIRQGPVWLSIFVHLYY